MLNFFLLCFGNDYNPGNDYDAVFTGTDPSVCQLADTHCPSASKTSNSRLDVRGEDESQKSFESRVVDFFKDMIFLYNQGDFLVIAEKSVIRIAVCSLLSLPELAERMIINPGNLTQISCDKGFCTLVCHK